MERCQQWRFTCFNTALNILKDDDGVIHHQANSQDQAQQGDQVDGKAKQGQANKRRRQADGNSNSRNDHGPNGAKEHVDHQAHQHHGDGQGDIDRLDSGLDKHRVVGAGDKCHACRQTGVDCGGFEVGRAQHIQRVGSRLFDDAEAHSGHTVTAKFIPVGGGPKFNFGDITEANQLIVSTVGDGKLAKVIDGFVGAFDAHRKFPFLGVYAARWQFDILPA